MVCFVLEYLKYLSITSELDRIGAKIGNQMKTTTLGFEKGVPDEQELAGKSNFELLNALKTVVIGSNLECIMHLPRGL